MLAVRTFLMIITCYLIGSIPFGYLVALSSGKDIRKMGSGNIGATNVARVLGVKKGALVLLLDAIKGLSAVYTAGLFMSNGSLTLISDPKWYHFVAAFAAIGGHSYSLFLKFSGGKGVATSFGAVLALFPLPTLLGLLTFALNAMLTRVVSIASLTASGVVAFCVLVLYENNLEARIFVLLTLALVYYRHLPNIRRIFSGEESFFKPGGAG